MVGYLEPRMETLPPEQKARRKIDAMLTASGWTVQDKKALNPSASLGVAVREYDTETGPADYILFVDRVPVGVVEAKPAHEGERITVHEDQAEGYAKAKLRWTVGQSALPFCYVSTGEKTTHWDQRDPKPRAREVFSFHKPETLQELLKTEPLRSRLTQFGPLDPEKLRDCQVNAITNLEKSFALNKPRALVQMATGSGKTFTAITSIYRLLKPPVRMRRILFLVDTKNLGEQAEQEFQSYTPNDDRRKFTELYTVQRLSSSFIDAGAQVCISTIQRMYSILQGVELAEGAEEASAADVARAMGAVGVVGADDRPPAKTPAGAPAARGPIPIAYNAQYPPEFFDLIIIDECHRSIYNLWRQVLEYFDAYLVGLTATPDSRTYAFFNENVVSEYTHEQAVADGVNVGYDEYLIETRITQKGAEIKAQQQVDKRDRLTRKRRWEQADEDITYTASLDRDVVIPSQIRTIIKAFKRAVETEIFPHRTEVPKTQEAFSRMLLEASERDFAARRGAETEHSRALREAFRNEALDAKDPRAARRVFLRRLPTFAKTDSHADDIIQIVREECSRATTTKKITYSTEEDPKGLLARFRNDYNPRIAVTVDMIATGTDVNRACACSMRDVKSRNYFEQIGPRMRMYRAESLMKRWTVWACPLAKPRGPAFRSKSALVVPPRLRAFRFNPSREMRDHGPTLNTCVRR